MFKWTWLVSVLAVGLGGSTGPRPAAAQTTPVPVVLSNTAAPVPGTVTYSGFGTPTVNSAGQVAFYASTSDGRNNIFVGAAGTVQVAARSGTGPNTAAPGVGGGSYTGFYDPMLNDAGQVAFLASTSSSSSPNGIFRGLPGSVEAVARQTANGTYTGLYNPVALNGAGQVAFQGLTNSSATAIYVGSSGTPVVVQRAAVDGGAVPGGGTYGTPYTPTLNGSGQVAFLSIGQGREIFAGPPGAVQRVVTFGTPAPAGGDYTGFDSPSLNNAGQVAFRATVTDNITAGSGVFVGAPGAIQAAALHSTAAPGGGTFTEFNSPAVNGVGQVAFRANTTTGAGVFVGAPGAIQAVARVGDAAPGGGTFGEVSAAALNRNGQVAFLGDVTGVPAGTERGLYATGAAGLIKVVRVGDQIDMDPGAGVLLRTVNGIGFDTADFNGNLLVSGGEDGRRVTFSDSGYLAYTLTFDDGTAGVFTSFVPVPEPTTVLGFAAAALLVGRRLRRRGPPVVRA